MTTYTWIGTSGPFTAPSFWRVDGTLTGGLPGTADTALFPGSAAYSVSDAAGADSLIVTNAAATIGLTGTIGFTNAATLANAGILSAPGTVSIGHYDIGPGAIAVSFANSGTIIGSPTADLSLYALVQPGALGAIDMQGGHLRLGGLYDNTGGTLSAARFDAGTLTISGTVLGGTIDTAATVDFQTNAALPTALLLDGVTLRGGFDGNLPAFIQHGLTVTDSAGTGPGTLLIGVHTGNDPQPGPRFLDSTTLDNMTLELSLWTGLGHLAYGIRADQDLTFGANLHFATLPVPGISGFMVSSLSVITAGSDITSHASMDLGAPIQISATGTFTNTGAIAATAGTLTVQANSFLNQGTYQATGAAGVVVAAPDFTNTGLVATGPGLLQVNGLGNGLVVGATVATNPGTFATSGGTILVNGNIDGAGTIDLANGGTATLRGLYGAQHFALHGAANVLELSSIGGTTSLIGFQPGDTLRLPGTPVDAVYAAGTLTLSSGTIALAAFLMPDLPANAAFVANVGTDSTTTITETIPCFALGTRIRTPSGDVAIEHLHPGELVVSAFGGTVAVLWVGRRTLHPARHRDPASVQPVRIAAGALADNLPSRDLLLSPEHALYIDGVLVPARHLVNGTTIRPEPRETVTYFHVELPQHDVLLAEGTPCESYLDTGNRADFAQPGAPVAAHPAFTPDTASEIWQSQACAPQCRDGARLDAIRAAIRRRERAALSRREGAAARDANNPLAQRQVL